MTKCSCKSEDGYIYSKDQNSWNKKDTIGILVFILILSIIISLLYTLYCWINSSPYLYHFIVITFILISIFVIACILRPILIMYVPSSILSFFIRTPTFLDRNLYFPNHKLLENPSTFKKIKDEVDTMLKKTNGGNELTLTQDTFSGQNKYIGSDIKIQNGKKRAWRLLNIKVGELYSQDAITNFPTLVRILKRIPNVKSCVISVLEPGIRIPIHVGYYKGVMRYMLATHVPRDRKNVFLCANGIKYNWTEGEGVLWDDTYAHKVYNNTDESRVIIYMDVIRPLKYSPLSLFDGVNEWLIDRAANSSIAVNEIKNTEKQIKI